MTCMNCGTSVPDSARFCPQCGKSTARDCSACHNTIAETDRFCAACGEPVITVPGAPSARTLLTPRVPPARPIATPQRQIRSLSGVGSVLAAAFFLRAALGIGMLSVLLGGFGQIEAIDYGDGFDEGWITALDVLGVLGLLLGVVILVLLIIWLWRATKNVEIWSPDVSLKAGWAIGGWFIPGANLVLPLLVAQNAWRGADPSFSSQPLTSRPRSALPIAWWCCTVIGFVIMRVVGISGSSDVEMTAGDLRALLTISLLGEAALIAGALLGGAMTLATSERHATTAQTFPAESSELARP